MQPLVPVQRGHLGWREVEAHVDVATLERGGHVRGRRELLDLGGNALVGVGVVGVGHQVHDVIHEGDGAARIQARGRHCVRAREHAASLDVARWARLVDHERPVGEDDVHRRRWDR